MGYKLVLEELNERACVVDALDPRGELCNNYPSGYSECADVDSPSDVLIF